MCPSRADPASPDIDEVGSEIIRTKLRPPSGSHPWIPRVGLEGGLDRLLAVPLTVVTAPAGFGKTTQLALWRNALESRGVATGWLSLDADDDDTHLFFAYLLEALSSSCSRAVHRARALIRNDPLLSYRQVLTVLLNEVASLDESLVLFLDDVHLLESPAVNDALYRFVRYAPANLHVVTAGRTEPMIHVSRFQCQRHLYRLDADDLRFSENDTRRFYSEMVGRPLDQQEGARLWRATEGWVAGIQLASIAHGGQGDHQSVAAGLEGASHEISVYLTENVLAEMPRQLLDFMLRISVLDRVSGALAARVTGHADSANLLEHLEQRNLFLSPLDDRREWYCFHALFLDYLRARAVREIPGELAALHDRASDFLASSGWWQEAVKHALAAGQDQKAAVWVEQCAMDLIRRSALRTVIGWLGRLPERVIAGSIRLRLAQAWAFTLGLQPGDAARTLGALEQDISTGRLDQGSDGELQREILSVRAIVAGLTDDSPRALRLARQVMALGPERGSWVERMAHTALSFGLAYESGFEEARVIQQCVEANNLEWAGEPTFAAVYQQCMFGLSALIEGRLVEAAAIFSNALRRGEDEVGADSAAATLPAGYLSTILYEWDELPHLEEVLRRRLSTALGVCANGSVSRFVVSLIRLQSLQGSFDQAFHTIERASRVARERGWLRLLSACQAQAIRLMLQDGDIVRANRTLELLLRSMPPRAPSPLGSFVEVRFNLATSSALLMLHKGLHEEPRETLYGLCRDLASVGGNYHLAQARILLAAALERGGDPEPAGETLKLALRYGQKSGMVRAFLDAQPEVGDVLGRIADGQAEQAGGDGLDGWYVENLAVRLGVAATSSAGAEQAGLASPSALLRPRERQVLCLLASGLSNKSIARQLAISPETVKWHFKNIFRKLALNSRVQAVRWAQENLPETSIRGASD